MAVLIPALSTCTSRMTPGERRLAERLQQQLDDDYLLWYDVPIGPKQCHCTRKHAYDPGRRDEPRLAFNEPFVIDDRPVSRCSTFRTRAIHR